LKELVAPLQKRHEARIAKDKEFQDLREDIAEVMKLRKENAISLNEAVRRKERDAQDARAKLREARLAAARSSVNGPVAAPGGKEGRSKVPEPARPGKAVGAARNALRALGLEGDERELSAEIDAGKAAKDAKDVLLQEAAHILADEAGML